MRDDDVAGLDRRDPARPTFLGRRLAQPDEPVFDQGLTFDVSTLLDRRRVLMGMGMAGIGAVLAACTPGAVTSSIGPIPTAGRTTGVSLSASPSPDAEGCALIPGETAGPFPGDGSNGPDVLSKSGVIRSDIRSSFGTSTTAAPGVPLTIRFELVDLADGCVPYAGAAVYAWHCDRDGGYSMYSPGIEHENYLRGVQAADDDGAVTFLSTFPGCYPGRWPHVHFEVYPTLDLASDASDAVATSQLAFPADVCAAVYATPGYESSLHNLAGVRLETDGVFGDDGGVRQLGSVRGSIDDGLTITLTVPIDLA